MKESIAFIAENTIMIIHLLDKSLLDGALMISCEKKLKNENVECAIPKVELWI